MSMKARDRLARAVARADRIEFIGIVWPIVIGAAAGVGLFRFAFPDGGGNARLLSGLGVLAGAFGVILWASVRRVHDMDRSGWWLLVLTVFGRVLQMVAIGMGHDAASPEILWTAIFMALAYLSVAPGTPGPNRFGTERARWVGPSIATPALSLVTPAAGTADFEGDLLELAADAYDLKSTVHLADVMGGAQLIIDSTGQVFAASRRKRGWRVDYVVEAVEAADFTDLQSRLMQSFPRRAEEWREESDIRSGDEQTKTMLEAVARAQTPKDLVRAIFDTGVASPGVETAQRP